MNIISKIKKLGIDRILIALIVFILLVIGYINYHKTYTENIIEYNENNQFTREIVEGEVFRQSFYTELGRIKGVNLLTANFDRTNTSNLKITVESKDGKDLYEQTFSLEDARNCDYTYFEFNKSFSTKHQNYVLIKLEAIGNDGGNGICLMKTVDDIYKNGNFYINNEKQTGDIFVTLYGNKTFKLNLKGLLITIALIAWMGMVACKSKGIKLYDKIQSEKIKNYSLLIVIFVSTILSGYIVKSIWGNTNIKIYYEPIKYSEGSLQLFYKDDKTEYSESKSSTVTTNDEGLAKFNLNDLNISQLRLDMDNINLIRIKKIEINKLGYNETIDSLNWGSYYQKQHNLDSVFDDNSSINYLSTGNDSYVVFDVPYGNLFLEKIIYIVLVIITLGLLCIAFKFISKIYFNENKSKDNLVYLIVGVCVALSVFFSMFNQMKSVVQTINNRLYIQYMIKLDNVQEKRVENFFTADFIAHGKKVIKQEFMIMKNDHIDEQIVYEIADEAGNVITEKEILLTDLICSYNNDWDVISIDCSEMGLERGAKYTFSFSTSDENISVIVNSDEEMQQRQLMKFSLAKYYNAIIITIAFFSIAVIILCIKHGFSDKYFLIYALVIGIVMCFIFPPCAADDEYRHFLRVYDIINSDIEYENTFDFDNAKGNIIVESQGAPIMKVSYRANNLRLLDKGVDIDNISYDAEMNYSANTEEILRLAFDSGYYFDNVKNYKVSITATASANALSYLPQIVMGYIAKIIGLNDIGVFYFSRIGNVIFCALIAFLCMKLIPEYKSIIMLAYFMPNASWIRSSCNRDCVVTAVAMLFISYLVYLKIRKIYVFKLKYIVILTMLSTIMAICKLPYVIISVLILIFDKENVCNSEKLWKIIFIKCALMVSIFAVGLVGYKISESNVFSQANEEVFFEEDNVQDDVSTEQVQTISHISYAIENPQKIAKVIYDRYKTIFTEDLYRAVCGYKYQFKKAYLWISLIIIILTPSILKFVDKVYLLSVFCIGWLGIVVVGYTWSSPDLGYIWGINPRYMIPFLPMLGLVGAVGTLNTQKIVNVIMPSMMIGIVFLDMISMIPIFI